MKKKFKKRMGKNKNFTLRLFRCKIFLNVKYFTCKKFYCKIFDHKIFSSVWNDKTRENATHHQPFQTSKNHQQPPQNEHEPLTHPQLPQKPNLEERKKTTTT